MFKYLGLIGYAAAELAALIPAGGAIAITQDGITEAKTLAVPYIFKAIHEIDVAEVDFDGGYLKNIKVLIDQPPVNDINVALKEAENGIELTGKSLSLTAKADFKYKYGFITADGTADIKIKDIGFDFLIDLSQQVGTPSYTKAPKLTAKKVDLEINPDDVDIELHGGLVTKIAKILIPLLKNSVIPTIVKQVEDTATDAINKQLDDDLKLYGTQATLDGFDSEITADYGMVGDSPSAKNGMLAIEVNGTFFSKTAGKYQPRDIPAFDQGGKNLQIHLADYVLNTLFESTYNQGDVIELTKPLDYLNATLTTDEIGVLIPDVLEHYGKGKKCSVFFTGEDSTSYVVERPGQIEFNLPKALLELKVDGETALKGDSTMDVSVDLSMSKGLLIGKNFKLTTKVIDVLETTMPELDVATLQAMLDANTQKAEDAVNAILEKGIKIPDNIGGLNLTDSNLDFHHGYVALGLTATSATWEVIGKILSAEKQAILAAMEAPVSLTQF